MNNQHGRIQNPPPTAPSNNALDKPKELSDDK